MTIFRVGYRLSLRLILKQAVDEQGRLLLSAPHPVRRQVLQNLRHRLQRALLEQPRVIRTFRAEAADQTERRREQPLPKVFPELARQVRDVLYEWYGGQEAQHRIHDAVHKSPRDGNREILIQSWWERGLRG